MFKLSSAVATLAMCIPSALAATGAIGNFTAVSGVINGGSASILIFPAEKMGGVDNVNLYEMVLEKQDGLSSAQILYNGSIIVSLLPTDNTVNNDDYAGIITYSVEEDNNPLSEVEEITIDGVTVPQYKEPGATFLGKAKASSSFTPEDFVGEFEGKSQSDFNAALAAGELSAIVRSFAYPDGELESTLKSTEFPEKDSSAASGHFGAVAGAFVMTGMTFMIV
jgi:hypothetical protein